MTTQPRKPRTTKKTTTTRKTTAKTKVNTINQDSGYVDEFLPEIPKTIEAFNAMIDERIYGGEEVGLEEIEQARRRILGE